MMTHGRSGLARVFYGSVAEEVLRSAQSPILLQRTAAVAATTPVSLRQAPSY